MPPDKKQTAKQCFKKGTEAMAKENWDYAVKMFVEASALDPENIFYQQVLRGCEERKRRSKP